MKKFLTTYFLLNFLCPFLCPFLYQYSFANKVIEDDLEKYLDKNLKIKEYKYQNIYDENLPKISNEKRGVLVDFEEFFPKNPSHFVKKKVIIDGISGSTTIKIKIKNYLTTKSFPKEGEIAEFETVEDIKIGNVLYKKGTTIKGRIENISQNESYGVPAEMILSNFKLGEISLAGDIEKAGANRTLWLRPVVWVTSSFFGAGYLLIPIRGGHAKIRPEEVFEIYY